jgi:hypothetical protein
MINDDKLLKSGFKRCWRVRDGEGRFGTLDARNGMNRAPRSSRDLISRSFENQLMGSSISFYRSCES